MFPLNPTELSMHTFNPLNTCTAVAYVNGRFFWAMRPLLVVRKRRTVAVR